MYGALAEASWGAGVGKSCLIYVTVGTGIGGGIILNGKLYRGVEGSHPEFAHQVIDVNGPPCSCGLSGCWEVWHQGWRCPGGSKRSLNMPGRRD